jgi:hypothetical protein
MKNEKVYKGIYFLISHFSFFISHFSKKTIHTFYHTNRTLF